MHSLPGISFHESVCFGSTARKTQRRIRHRSQTGTPGAIAGSGFPPRDDGYGWLGLGLNTGRGFRCMRRCYLLPGPVTDEVSIEATSRGI